jgi:hypothetical protein
MGLMVQAPGAAASFCSSFLFFYAGRRTLFYNRQSAFNQSFYPSRAWLPLKEP